MASSVDKQLELEKNVSFVMSLEGLFVEQQRLPLIARSELQLQYYKT